MSDQTPHDTTRPTQPDPETEMEMLLLLMTFPPFVPAGYVLTFTAQYDAITRHTQRRLYVHPRDVAPAAFTAGTTGAYALLTVHPHEDNGFGYHVEVVTPHGTSTFEHAGTIVTFTDPTEALITAVWQIRAAQATE